MDVKQIPINDKHRKRIGIGNVGLRKVQKYKSVDNVVDQTHGAGGHAVIKD